MFTGSFVAIVTPFKNGKVDYDALAKLIEFQIANGTNGIVPCGTTGESATLSFEEHEEVIRFTIETAKKRVQVMAGTGSNNTAEALTLTKAAKKLGADAALLISPYYNKPTQKGLYEHFKYISEAVDFPIFLYNVPGRTSVNITPQTAVALSKIKNIVGIKEASGNILQVSEIIRDANPRFIVLSGDDALTYPIMAIGGHGVISVTANVEPKKVANLTAACMKGDYEIARKQHLELLELHDIMFVETNPIPVKEALSMMGKINLEFRMPLTTLTDASRDKLKAVLKKYGLIS